MRLTPATDADLAGLLPARVPRRVFQAYRMQLRRSEAWTFSDGQGVAAVGGLYPSDDGAELECWLHLRAEPRVRVKGLLVAILTVLELDRGGVVISAYVDAGSARNLRFAEFLGFISRHEVPATRLTPRSVRLVRTHE